jgi:hypothetical protein
MPDDLENPRPDHPGARTKEGRNPAFGERGVRRDYILARLERDGRHGLAEAIRAGQVSAWAVAIELGWTSRPERLGTGSSNAEKLRAGAMRTLRQEGAFDVPSGELGPAEKMELITGPGQMGSFFRTREELHRAWLVGRDELLARAQPGRRPAGYYEFEWEGDRPPYDLERSTLWRLGLLDEAERAALETEWREEFDRAQAPGFVEYENSGIVTGARARRLYYAWADIPREFVKRWRAERRARQKSAA